jgi:hypothetical protein
VDGCQRSTEFADYLEKSLLRCAQQFTGGEKKPKQVNPKSKHSVLHII